MDDLAHIKLDLIEDAIRDISMGKVIIVVDDENRENEGDFVCAASCVTPKIINFMATYGRGLICAPITEQRAKELELSPMVEDNNALHETAFTVSVDLIGQGCTTGISAFDRAAGIKALVDPKSKPSDFARPGHIFPLRAKDGGVLRRTGHTEAAIDLARMAGYAPAGVLVEILNEDGSMARLPQLEKIAERHQLKLITIRDLVAFRMQHERIIRREFETHIDSQWGKFNVIAYTQLTTGDTHLAITKGNWKPDEPVLVRMHSSTETGDILGSLFGDYGIQLRQSMKMISDAQKGVLVYIRHSEKGSSILNRLKLISTEKRDQKSEQRDFGIGAQILRDLEIRKIRLLTRHPRKRIALGGYGLEIVENVELPLGRDEPDQQS